MTEPGLHNMISDVSDALPRTSLVAIFDLDDTLLDTTLAVQKLLLPQLAKLGISEEVLAEARKAAHRENNTSFDVAEYVISHHGQEAWAAIAAAYIEEGKGLDLFLPGAHEVVGMLRRAHIPVGIKTYGNPQLQVPKRDAMRVPADIPFHVINHRDKGKMLDAAYDAERQEFVIEWLGYCASHVVMFENDPTAFNGLEEHIATGRVLAIWVPHSQADRQKPMPVGVREAQDLTSGLEILIQWTDIPEIRA